MQEIIAGLEQFTFTFEKDVEMQKGTGLLPFQGMDKSGSAVCNFFAKGLCEKGGSAGEPGRGGLGPSTHPRPLAKKSKCSGGRSHPSESLAG
uniref:Uncharacterized protein n=1 Tax=Lynx canadensis TaxID=61383 RepID=A0A667IJD4_LYNCA